MCSSWPVVVMSIEAWHSRAPGFFKYHLIYAGPGTRLPVFDTQEYIVQHNPGPFGYDVRPRVTSIPS